MAGMSTITVPLPEEHLKFLRSYTSAQRMSAEAFLAQRARNRRENLQRSLPSEVVHATGMVEIHRLAATCPSIYGEHLEVRATKRWRRQAKSPGEVTTRPRKCWR